MKLKKLHVVCVAALAVLSGPAFSQAVTKTGVPEVSIFKGGASATQNTFGAVAKELFQDTSGDGVVTDGVDYFVYYDNTGTTPGTAYRAYFGRVKNVNSVILNPGADQTTITIPAALKNKSLMIQDRAKGGSVWGVDPVARGQGIENMLVSAASCPNFATQAGSIANPILCGVQGSDANPAQTTAPNRVPDFGLSDVEPGLFKAPLNTEFPNPQLAPAELARFTGTTFPGFMLAFGAPVNKVAGNDTADIPSLAFSTYSSMLSGKIRSWADVPGYTGGATRPQVIVCRRVPGSGSQAIANQETGNAPCGTGSIVANGALAPASTVDSASVVNGTLSGSGTAGDPFVLDPADGFTVIENSASGNVRSCLAAAKNGGTINWNAQVDVDGDGIVDNPFFRIVFPAGTPYRAVGVLSQDSAATADWDFRKIDGVTYSKSAMKNGQWSYVSENTFQYRNDSPAYLTANAATLPAINTVIAFAQDPNVLLNVTPATLATVSLAIPSATRTPTNTNNVGFYTRGGNTCRPFQKF